MEEDADINRDEDVVPGGRSVDARDACRDASHPSMSSSLTRTLYAAQLVNESKARSRSREAFHRSMLAARIANDEIARRRGGRGEREEGANASSIRGGEWIDGTPTLILAAFDDDEAVPVSSSSALKMMDLEVLSGDDDDIPRDARENPRDVVAIPTDYDAEVLVPSSFATAVVGGGDDRSPGTKFSTAGRGMSEDATREAGEESTVPSSSYEAERIRRRDTYVREIWNSVHGKAIERTRLRMSLRNNVIDDNASRMGSGVVDRVNLVVNDHENDDDEDDDGYVGDDDENDFVHDVDASVRTNVHRSSYSASGGTVRRDFRRLGFVRRVRRQRRSFLLVALAVVVSRRLFLVYFGNALRLI